MGISASVSIHFASLYHNTAFAIGMVACNTQQLHYNSHVGSIKGPTIALHGATCFTIQTNENQDLGAD